MVFAVLAFSFASFCSFLGWIHFLLLRSALFRFTPVALLCYQWLFSVRIVCFLGSCRPRTHIRLIRLTLFFDQYLIWSFGCSPVSLLHHRDNRSKKHRALTDHYELCPVVLVLLLRTIKVR